MNSEQERLKDASKWYLNGQLEFDKKLIGFRYESIRQFFVGANGLELGPAEGEMTRFLINDFESLTVVDAANDLLEMIPAHEGLTKVNSLFEEFETDQRFDCIVMDHILEHVDDPAALLDRVKQWLSPGGRVVIGVPNANSIHRLVATKMGLLDGPSSLNERDLQVGHRRVYTMDSLRQEVEESGFDVLKMGGVFLKPLSNKQIEDGWSDEMIDGFFKLGVDLPFYSAEIFAVCEINE
jgi:2-polyprenyl-3-methyl-5-hydroxy-6-metoxy-1,4-benzoquinol methylase